MKKSYWVKFSILEIAYWCFSASFISYLVSYLLSKGISNTILSLYLASYLFAAFIGSFAWGAVCDHFHTNRKIIILSFLLTLLVIYLIYFLAPNKIMLSFLYPLLGFLIQPQATNIDSWLLLTCHNSSSIYGKIRCQPSVLFAFVSFFLGRLISLQGYYFMLIFSTFFLLLGICTALITPEDIDPQTMEKPVSINLFSIKELFSISSYRYMIILLFFIGLAITPINNLKITVLNSVGGDVSSLGIDSFVAAFTQVPFIALAGKTEKLSLRLRYTLVTALPFLSVLSVFFATRPYMIFISSVFYNIAFGILLPTMRAVTENSVPPVHRNLGHYFADAVFNSFTGILSLLYSGILIDLCGMKALLFVCLICSLIPLFMVLIKNILFSSSSSF